MPGVSRNTGVARPNDLENDAVLNNSCEERMDGQESVAAVVGELDFMDDSGGGGMLQAQAHCGAHWRPDETGVKPKEQKSPLP